MLSPRLALIASLVPKGARVADIGTDHAYLPIELIKSGRASKCIAADIRELPLAKAKRNIDASGVSGIVTLLSDGLSGIKQGECDTVVIAGMGGDVAVHILKSCPYIKDGGLTLILQPMTSADVLRVWLADNGFSVISEPCVHDGGRLYAVMLAKYTGEVRTLREADALVGRTPFYKGAENRLYVEKVLSALTEKRNGLAASGRSGEAAATDVVINDIISMREGHHAV